MKVEPKQLRASLVRSMKRAYTTLLFVCVVLSAAGFLVLLFYPKVLSFGLFAGFLILTAFVIGGFFPIARFAKLEQYIQTLEQASQ